MQSTAFLAVLAAVLTPPAAAEAAGTWTCRASGGWVASGGQTSEPLVAGGTGVCETATARSAAPGPIAFAKPAATTASGPAGATTDTQRPVAEVTAESVVIENEDGSLRVTARDLRARAEGACSSSRAPRLGSGGGIRDVTVNGRPIAADRDFSEPGVGVNGAPLFGRLQVRFAEVAADGDAGAGAQRIVRRTMHVIVTDSAGTVVFEAVAGEVVVGREGPVCDPPPVCPEGQQLDPGANRCVEVEVSLPEPPGTLPPAPLPPAPLAPQKPPARGCADANARPGSVAAARLRVAAICLLNAERSRRGLRRLRVNDELELAARRHARDMVVRRYFAHESPSGAGVLDRILRTRYLRRYGRWRIGEILGWGWGARGTPAAIVAGWMRSPPHRREVLGRYTELGVGVQRAAPRRLSRPATTFVVEFGTFRR